MLLDPETLDLAPDRGRGGRCGSRRGAAEARAARLAGRDHHRARIHRGRGDGAAGRRTRASSPRPPPVAPARRAPAPIPSPRPTGCSTEASATSARWPTTGPRRDSSWCARCKCTSRSAGRTAPSPSTTACAPTCPSWPRWPPTPRGTRARTPASPRSGRSSPRRCRARACRRRSRAGRRWRASCAGAVESDTIPEPGRWWWELRPHPSFGTLELRVPDAQTTLAHAAGVTAFSHALVGWLAARHDDGERLPVAHSWRIGENRWSALRSGVEGTLVDLETGERAAHPRPAARAGRRHRPRGRASSAARPSWTWPGRWCSATGRWPSARRWPATARPA